MARLISPPPSYASYNTFPRTENEYSAKGENEGSSKTWKKVLLIAALLISAAILVSHGVFNEKDLRTPEEKEKARLDLERAQEERERQRWQFEREREERQKEQEKARREEEQKRKEHQKEQGERRREEEQRRRERQREEEERRNEEEKRHELEREKLSYRNAGIYWDVPNAEHCVVYGTRQYTARLWDIPFGYDWHKACVYTPIAIHNKTIEEPDRCDDRGYWGGMYGNWLVDFDEVYCRPYWGSFSELGCTSDGSGKHRIESRLWNLQKGGDWFAMCGTTPAVIHGVQYPQPTYCDNKGILFGLYGIWDIDDPGCL